MKPCFFWSVLCGVSCVFSPFCLVSGRSSSLGLVTRQRNGMGVYLLFDVLSRLVLSFVFVLSLFVFVFVLSVSAFVFISCFCPCLFLASLCSRVVCHVLTSVYVLHCLGLCLGLQLCFSLSCPCLCPCVLFLVLSSPGEVRQNVCDLKGLEIDFALI